MTAVSDRFSAEHIDAVAAELEGAAASTIVRWAVDTFGHRVVLLASMQDAVLIDIAVRVAPGIEVAFIDTGDHFPETLAMAEAVRERYHLNLRVVRVPQPEVPFHVQDPVKCCSEAKVAALDEILADKDAWLSGLRRAEADTRADAPVVSVDRRGKVKINPLATWTDLDVAGYAADRDIPVHPLIAEGYLSIGCACCTTPVEPGAHPRSGRWAGLDKTECGLHEE